MFSLKISHLFRLRSGCLDPEDFAGPKVCRRASEVHCRKRSCVKLCEVSEDLERLGNASLQTLSIFWRSSTSTWTSICNKQKKTTRQASRVRLKASNKHVTNTKLRTLKNHSLSNSPPFHHFLASQPYKQVVRHQRHPRPGYPVARCLQVDLDISTLLFTI